jgi:hypothetical protein
MLDKLLLQPHNKDIDLYNIIIFGALPNIFTTYNKDLKHTTHGQYGHPRLSLLYRPDHTYQTFLTMIKITNMYN